MNRCLLAVAALVLGTLSAWAGEPAPVWLTDYAKARERARQTGKPLFVIFRCEH